MITKKEFRDWQDDPITQRVFELLNGYRDDNNDLLLTCVPNYESKENCLLSYGKLIGSINAYDSLLQVCYEEVEPDGEEDDKPEGDKTHE